MQRLTNKKVLVKIGSAVFFNKNNNFNALSLKHIVDECNQLQVNGCKVVIVNSGAIRLGAKALSQHLFHPTEPGQNPYDKNFCAAIGQMQLMNHFAKYFKKVPAKLPAQILVNRDDLSTHYGVHLKCLIEGLLDLNVTPLINGNDAMRAEEFFVDNDFLTLHLCTLLDINTVIFLSDVDGVYTKSPRLRGSQVIPHININNPDQIERLHNLIEFDASRGTGGMQSKINNALEISRLGIECYIVNGKRKNILEHINTNTFKGTYFFPLLNKS